jgi:hypothetical protein
LVAEGELSKDLLDPNDVFIVDDGKKVIVWIGGGASSDENKNALSYAHVSCIWLLAGLLFYTNASITELLDGN